MATINPQQLEISTMPLTFEHLPEDSQQLLCQYNWTTNDIEHLCTAVRQAQIECAKLSPYAIGSWLFSHADMWRSIDDLVFCLLNSGRAGLHLAGPAESDLLQGLEVEMGKHQLEDSDIDDEDASSLFPELADILANFKRAWDRSFLVIKPLNARQRRHVHAIAHFSHFGHMSVGSGPYRMLLLSQDPKHLPSWLKKTFKHARAPQAMLPKNFASHESRTDPVADLLDSFDIGTDGQNFGEKPWQIPQDFLQPYNTYDLPDATLESPDLNPISGYTSVGSYGSLSNSQSAEDSFSDSFGRRRKKRQLRAFPCMEPGCSEVFDRQCDLGQHRRSHIPYDQRPEVCDKCGKRFTFPKDLRRHEQTHSSFFDILGAPTRFKGLKAQRNRLSRRSKRE